MTIRRFILALMIALTCQPVLAQAWRVGPQTVDYSAQTIGDGSNAYGGTPSYFSSGAEPSVTDQVDYTRSAWLGSGGTKTDGSDEKFRITCNFAKFGSFDPILYKGQAKVGHHHTFIGSMGVDQNSDYVSLRSSGKSTCSGGPLNRTAYWEPSLMTTLPSGARVAYKPNNVSFYYTQNAGQGASRQRLPRDFAFIGVANPMNFNDTAVRKELTDAGLVGGSVLLYEAGGPATSGPAAWGGLGNHGTPAGLIGWYCIPNGNGGNPATVVEPHGVRFSSDAAYRTDYARYLKGPFGEDPWGGACTAGKLILSITAPHCWDGVNPRSPDGRSHVRYAVRNQHNTLKDICPKNWYKVPGFEAKTEFEHKGWTADLQYRFLSSDRMRVSTTECPDATAPCDGISGGNDPEWVNGVYYTRISNDPCRARTVDFCNGATAHFDWMGAWDQTVMNTWMAKCLNMNSAITGLTAVAQECNGPGTISYVDNISMATGVPPDASLANNPIVDSSSSYDQDSVTRFAPVEDGQTGPFNIHGHGGMAMFSPMLEEKRVWLIAADTKSRAGLAAVRH